ncbi:hypothetical protein AB0J86_12875 [Micromonospora sp. NPDC049559]|uniref:hypothetical protein n=1 Tax=Micromonospora sp. NPDC049559 TaxID=3155923 RepID=UPI00342B0BDF
MRLSRIITALVAGLAVAGVPAAAGAAQPYPPQPPSLTATDTTVEIGQATTLIGTGFGANELVRLDFTFTPLAARAPGAQPARVETGGMGAMAPASLELKGGPAIPSTTVRANSEGRFTKVVKFHHAGQVLVTATGLSTARVASVTITVFRPQPGLPVTGSSVGSQLAVGGGLLATGVLLVLMTVVWRRRRRQDVTAGSMS